MFNNGGESKSLVAKLTTPHAQSPHTQSPQVSRGKWYDIKDIITFTT